MAHAEQPGTLPTWDVSTIYPALDSPEFRSAMEEYLRKLGDLEAFFDEYDIRELEETPSEVPDGLAPVLEGALTRINDVRTLGDTLQAYVYSYVSTDSYNDEATQYLSKLQKVGVRMQQIMVRFTMWVGSFAVLLPEVVAQNECARDHHYTLKRAELNAEHTMSEEMEGLASELVLDGGNAFGRLQGTITSQLKVPFERDGKTEELPITVVLNMRTEPQREVRERAYRTELEGWKSVRTPIAACLNHVKGTALTLAKHRGWDSVLDIALDKNRVSRAVLDALMNTIREYVPTFRRYFEAKAQKLGLERLAWWDTAAPVGESRTLYDWAAAREFIVQKFSGFADDLGELAARAFDEQWIDALPREGKRAGAFCMPIVGHDQSRILQNYDGSVNAMSTLAHELGHAYHNHCQRGLEPLRRGSPSTLAETASIFCETLIAEAMLRDAQQASENGEDPRDEMLAILEAQLQRATGVCLDISSRFIFESNVFAIRAERELSADEFCELMRDAQAETYGEAVDPSTYHPYMWVWKPHYYSWGNNFYNFPYAFGHLFGLGLYAIYEQEGEPFLPRYRELLRHTNQDDAEPLAERFGIDLASPDFWRQGLERVKAQCEHYASL